MTLDIHRPGNLTFQALAFFRLVPQQIVLDRNRNQIGDDHQALGIFLVERPTLFVDHLQAAADLAAAVADRHDQERADRHLAEFGDLGLVLRMVVGVGDIDHLAVLNHIIGNAVAHRLADLAQPPIPQEVRPELLAPFVEQVEYREIRIQNAIGLIQDNGQLLFQLVAGIEHLGQPQHRGHLAGEVLGVVYPGCQHVPVVLVWLRL